VASDDGEPELEASAPRTFRELGVDERLTVRAGACRAAHSQRRTLSGGAQLRHRPTAQAPCR